MAQDPVDATALQRAWDGWLQEGAGSSADELFRARAQQSSSGGELTERAIRLERLVDAALAQMGTNDGPALLDHPRTAS